MFGGIKQTVSKLLHPTKRSNVTKANNYTRSGIDAEPAKAADQIFFLSGLPILAVCLVDFHHSRGPDIECLYPDVLEECRDLVSIGTSHNVDSGLGSLLTHRMIKLHGEYNESVKYCFVEDDSSLRLLRYCDLISCLRDIPSYALPDGSHKVIGESSTLLILPTGVSNIPLYAISTLNSINVSELEAKDSIADYTREVVQKSLVVISEIPHWDLLLEYNRKFCQIIFDKKDFKCADQMMGMMATALNHEILTKIQNLTVVDSMPSDMRCLIRRIQIDQVPLRLSKWVAAHQADTLEIHQCRANYARKKLVQEYVMQHVPQKILLILVKCMLLESRILVWGPNSAIVSSLVVYMSSVLPLYQPEFTIDLADSLILPYAPLDLVDRLDKDLAYVIGTTNSVLISDILRPDVLVLLPHEDSLTVSKESFSSTGQSARHYPSSKIPVLDFRNKRLKHAAQIGESEAKLLKSVASRTRDLWTKTADDSGADENDKNSTSTTNNSPRRFSDFAIGSIAVTQRQHRRGSVHVFQRAATAATNQHRAIASSKSMSCATLKGDLDSGANDESSDRAREHGHSYFKFARGFRMKNFPDQMIKDLFYGSDFGMVVKCFLELLCRLSAFGGGECRDLACLKKVMESNRMFYQISSTSNFSGSFWSTWTKTKNFDRMFRSNTLPKVPHFTSTPPKLGFARFQYSNGDLYRGWYSRGLRHEAGYYRGHNLLYNGQWFEDRRCGNGLFRIGKLWHAGEWHNDTRNGIGITQYDANEFQCGTFRDNNLHGYGVYSNAALGLRYEGHFDSGKFQGEGILQNLSGQPFGCSVVPQCPGSSFPWNVPHDNCTHLQYIYKGNFEHGRFHGIGSLLTGNDSSSCGKCSWLYVGEFDKGCLEGQGQMYYRDGSIYVGKWSNNCRTRGVYYSTTLNKSEWLGNALVDASPETLCQMTRAIESCKRVLLTYSVLTIDELQFKADLKDCPITIESVEKMKARLHFPLQLPTSPLAMIDSADWVSFEGGWFMESVNTPECVEPPANDMTSRRPKGGSKSRTQQNCYKCGLERADQNMTWSICYGVIWRYTGGIILEESCLKFNGYGQIVLSDGVAIECYWHHGCQQGAAVLRFPNMAVQWGAWLEADDSAGFVYSTEPRDRRSPGRSKACGVLTNLSSLFLERLVFPGTLIVPK